MNIIVITISILISVICVLLVLLQQYYFIVNVHETFTIHNFNPEFEDFIPKDVRSSELGYPIESYNKDSVENSILNDLRSALNLDSEESGSMNVLDDDRRHTDSEVYYTIRAALAFKLAGKNNKAMKLFEHASVMALGNADILNWYGEFLERHNDIVTADELYCKALSYSPEHRAALSNKERTTPVVDMLDLKLFHEIEKLKTRLKERMKLDNFDSVKKQAYYLHIHHTVGIEGNTMTVEQLRYVLETGHVISGKTLLEHNEILGLEKAIQYVKLLTRTNYISIKKILGIHRRVMGYVDPMKSGVLRDTTVFIGSHVSSPPDQIATLMKSYVKWLNSEEARRMHPGIRKRNTNKSNKDKQAKPSVKSVKTENGDAPVNNLEAIIKSSSPADEKLEDCKKKTDHDGSGDARVSVEV
ncbi:unnamed protein product [Ceutorhynchus assimilis]|uniref:Uncharacterized protein n=1 Tax=Ceutorhynchus assimilis TaxID=467358 RepID=A0A9N9MT68_9CUCU|nr:unnamed protein product [Ceutorhynchus assimilis]